MEFGTGFFYSDRMVMKWDGNRLNRGLRPVCPLIEEGLIMDNGDISLVVLFGR
jgi:hypothetical protein